MLFRSVLVRPDEVERLGADPIGGVDGAAEAGEIGGGRRGIVGPDDPIDRRLRPTCGGTAGAKKNSRAARAARERESSATPVG